MPDSRTVYVCLLCLFSLALLFWVPCSNLGFRMHTLWLIGGTIDIFDPPPPPPQDTYLHLTVDPAQGDTPIPYIPYQRGIIPVHVWFQETETRHPPQAYLQVHGGQRRTWEDLCTTQVGRSDAETPQCTPTDTGGEVMGWTQTQSSRRWPPNPRTWGAERFICPLVGRHCVGKLRAPPPTHARHAL